MATKCCIAMLIQQLAIYVHTAWHRDVNATVYVHTAWHCDVNTRAGRYDTTIIDTTDTDTSSCSIDTWFLAIPIRYLAHVM